MKNSAFRAAMDSIVANILFSVLVPLITLITLEWIARGTLGPVKQGSGFFQALDEHFLSFFIAYLLLFFMYVFISQLSGWHALATAVVGLVGNVPAVVTYYKLTMRGEPFLPWDLTQINDLMGVSSSLSFSIQPSMIITLLLFVLLSVAAGFVHLPYGKTGRKRFIIRFSAAGTALACGLGLLFGVFLSPAGTAAAGIEEDMWMQDRYYRNHGVVTGFLTNLQLLQISQPAGYSEDNVLRIAGETTGRGSEPYYQGSYATTTDAPVQQPDIIFLMAESFWDVQSLPGIVYDRDLTPNLTALAAEGAYGKAYTPSFGGGTCDVEFEALTGFSMEHLPSGSKPFQQYVTDDMFSLPNYLKSQGYATLGIHGYGRRFWNRDTAYPRLGIDEFIAQEDFVNPSLRRGFISDDAMVERIIEEHQNHADGSPVFIHAVTMQNHTTYNRNRYPAGDLVKVLRHNTALPDSTIGQLEDCATGIYEMDAALGKLAEYLKTTDRPTILVFWGDHLNPMSDGFKLFEETGYIEEGDTASHKLHETPLLIWSNYATNQVQLGTLATYYITPVMMDLYGLDMPLMFQHLTGQLDVMRARTRGVTIGPDGAASPDMTKEQRAAFDEHAALQYDFMFGSGYLRDYTPDEDETVTS